MRSRTQSIPVPPATLPPFRPRQRSPDEVIFRQTALWRLGGGPYEPALESIGDLFAELMNEAGMWGAEEDPISVSQLRAAARDAEALAAFIMAVAEERFEIAIEPDVARLCERAESWASRLAGTAEEMVAALSEVEE